MEFLPRPEVPPKAVRLLPALILGSLTLWKPWSKEVPLKSLPGMLLEGALFLAEGEMGSLVRGGRRPPLARGGERDWMPRQWELKSWLCRLSWKQGDKPGVAVVWNRQVG